MSVKANYHVRMMNPCSGLLSCLVVKNETLQSDGNRDTVVSCTHHVRTCTTVTPIRKASAVSSQRLENLCKVMPGDYARISESRGRIKGYEYSTRTGQGAQDKKGAIITA